MAGDQWFRMYNAAADHPKVLLLTDSQFRAWVILLSLASKLGGVIPDSVGLVAVTLRKSVQKAADVLQVLLSAGLLDRVDAGYAPHNWNERQFKNDVSTQRVKRFRERQRNAVPETDQRQSTETESKKKKEPPAVAVVVFTKPVLPDWIDQDAWNGWLEVRQRIRAPNTGRALKLAITELDELRKQGHDPTAIIDQSTQRAWKSFFPIKPDHKNGQAAPRKSPHAKHFDATAAVVNDLLADDGQSIEGDGGGDVGQARRALLPPRFY